MAYGLAARCRIIAVNGKDWSEKNDEKATALKLDVVSDSATFSTGCIFLENEESIRNNSSDNKKTRQQQREQTVSNTPLRNAGMNSLKPEIFMNSQQVL